MVQLFLQDYGTVYKLFISSPNPKDIEYQYFSLYNREATSGGLYDSEYLIEGNPSSFIWTNKKKLLQYFYNVLENEYCLRFDRETDGGPKFKEFLMKKAAEKIDKLQRLRTVDSVKTKIYGDFNYCCDVKYDYFE